MKLINAILLSQIMLFGCNVKNCGPLTNEQNSFEKDTFIIYTKPSTSENLYKDFNSNMAINRIADIENEYFNNYQQSYSKYYGTMWYLNAVCRFKENDSINLFNKYRTEIKNRNEKADSMHCTIYAVEALKAGLDTNFNSLQKHHKRIWNNREHAGWSIAYILTKYFNWKAYLFISEFAGDFKKCINNFNAFRTYDVWRQPDIPLNEMFDFEKDKQQIDSLLNLNEFGWGFSDQGLHTWITRFNILKECNWTGCPSKEYEIEGNKPLFKLTKFTEFYDYSTHIIVFPPKFE